MGADRNFAPAELGLGCDPLQWRKVGCADRAAGKGIEMGLDQSKIGRVVAEQMEAIEGDYGEDCEIGDVCTIVEVIGPHGSHVRVRSSDMRPHSGLGLIRMAEQAMLGNLGGTE